MIEISFQDIRFPLGATMVLMNMAVFLERIPIAMGRQFCSYSTHNPINEREREIMTVLKDADKCLCFARMQAHGLCWWWVS